MAPFIGADTADVRQRAALLNALSADLAEIEGKLRLAFQGSTWVGQDAERTRTELDAHALPAIRLLQEFTARTATLMIDMAAQQDAASA